MLVHLMIFQEYASEIHELSVAELRKLQFQLELEKLELYKKEKECVPIKILRYWIFTIIATLAFSDESSAGASLLIKWLISQEYTPVPPHTVYLSSDLASGPVSVGIWSLLPFEGHPTSPQK